MLLLGSHQEALACKFAGQGSRAKIARGVGVQLMLVVELSTRVYVRPSNNNYLDEVSYHALTIRRRLLALPLHLSTPPTHPSVERDRAVQPFRLPPRSLFGVTGVLRS